jgi:hypothetical protein
MSPRQTTANRGGEPQSIGPYHAFEINGWDWTFSFGANESGDIDGPYWDYILICQQLWYGRARCTTQLKRVTTRLQFLRYD